MITRFAILLRMLIIMNTIKSCGHYFGGYDIAFEEYTGADFSRRCFIFPGQGSAFPGMFKMQYLTFGIISEHFKKADLLAKRNNLPKISAYILDPDSLPTDSLPIVRNLALFTLEVGLYELLLSQKRTPEIVTGHSFGEYAALVVAGVVNFEEMFDIVYHRDLFSPKPNSLGSMIAINANEDEIRNALLDSEFYISNLNSPFQTVISAAENMVEEIAKILSEKKLRYKVLTEVPQPYHSPLLIGVQEKIQEYLNNKELDLKKPQIPIFSSVLQKLISKENFKKEEILFILANQITAPVNFIYQINAIHELRNFNFIEVGAKNIFIGFVKDIIIGKEFKTDSALNILENIQQGKGRVISQENNKLFSLVSKVIGEITGYEIEKISMEDRYQDDLGIDSIKKADILLTVLSESEINPGEDFNTSNFSSVKDTVDFLDNIEKKGISKASKNAQRETLFGRYIFAWQALPLVSHLLLSARTNNDIYLNLTEIHSANENLIEKIAFSLQQAGGKTSNLIILANYQEFDYEKMLSFFDFWRNFLKTIKTDNFNLVLVSTGKSCPLIDAYASFFKSMKRELAVMFFKHIHFQQKIAQEQIFAIVSQEMQERIGVDVLYDEGLRFISVRKEADDKIKKVYFEKDFVIVAIGGAKGITFSLIKNISKKYKSIIYLAGRSPKDNETVRNNINELKKYNANIHYEVIDGRELEALDELFSKIQKKHKKIDLVLNGAGVVDISFIKDKTLEQANYELGSKVLPAVNVLELSKKYKFKKVINFSSVISKYGSAGQSVYTMANELVGSISAQYTCASVVHWPPWDSVGMTENKGIFRKLDESGVAMLKAEKADELFYYEFNSLKSQAIYYMDKDDDSLYGFSLSDFARYQSLLGKMANPFDLSVFNSVFEKTFDLSKDIYLKDHCIKGVSYVPAAVGISMFLCLGEMRGRDIPILKNIKIVNPIIVKEAEILKCQLGAKKTTAGYDFSIKSNALHFSAQTRIKNNKKLFYEIAKAEKEILVNSIYCDYYSKDSLYLGPIFQSINRVFLDKADNMYFRIDNSKLLSVMDAGIYDKLIQWVDVSFQSLGATALKNNIACIPVSVSSLATFLHNDVSNYLYVIPTVTKFDRLTIEGDVVIVNEKHEVVLEMKGIILKSIKEYAENKLKIVKYESN